MVDDNNGVDVSADVDGIDLTDPVDWRARCEAAGARADLAERRAESYRLALRHVHNAVLSVEDVLDGRGHR